MARTMDPSVAQALEQLASVKEQQLTSVQSIAALKAQHHDWQQHLTELLGRIEVQLQVHAPEPSPENSPWHIQTEASQPAEAGAKPKAKTGMAAQVSARVQRSRGDVEENDEVAEAEESLFESKFEETDEGAPETQVETRGRVSSRTTLEDIFRTRKTVLPKDNQPIALGSVVLEEMAATTQVEEPPLGDLWSRFKSKAAYVAHSSWFEFASGFVIMVNLATIGAEAELSLAQGVEFGRDSWPYLVERVFLAIYLVEAVVRGVGIGWPVLKDGWFLMDAGLVCVGLLALLVVPSFGATELEGVEKLLIVRGLRLLRLLRALRMVSHFKIMWRLVHGLLTSAETILAVTMLLLVLIFVFACVAVEVIAKDKELAKHDELTEFVIDEYFSSLHVTVMTLMQFVTMDSLATIYFPLILARPSLLFFFLPMLIFISIGLMNLVTAALVENAMKHQVQVEEEHKIALKAKVREALPAIVKIFEQLDQDKSGNITQEELRHVPVDVLPPKVLSAVCADSWEELFEYLDVDGTGTLSQTEFVEGLLNLCLLDMPIATVQTLKLLQIIRSSITHIDDSLLQIKSMGTR